MRCVSDTHTLFWGQVLGGKGVNLRFFGEFDVPDPTGLVHVVYARERVSFIIDVV